MSETRSRILHTRVSETLVATVRRELKNRDEVRAALAEVRGAIPAESIAGPGFCIFRFVTSVKEGYDAEVGFPVTRAIDRGGIETRVLPAMEVLSYVHRGPAEDIGTSYRGLYGYASEHGLISDEFCREVYLDRDAGGKAGIEIQFVIHAWRRLLAANVNQVLGEGARRKVTRGSDDLTPESPASERFRWVKGAIERLEGLATEEQRYDVLSRCAHVFPAGQIDKLRAVYQQTKDRTGDVDQAVDAVIAFMDEDPGWGEPPRREGNVIYCSKKPRDPRAYEKAESALEKGKAYCFCPLVREHLAEGMPVTFCYCGAGWYRQQWEGAIGKPVRVEIVRSLLKGDDLCEFAIRLPDDLWA
jgi:effector-binding domain-containing protein